MNKKLLMLVGIAGSGKSTWAKRYMKNQERQGKNIAKVSRDEIRFSLVKENEEYFAKETQVFNTYIENIRKYLEDNITEIIVADATHISVNARKKVLKKLNLSNVTVEAVVFETPIPRCIEQNEQRKGREYVPRIAIYNMRKHFTIPTYEEGFNKIIRINASLDRNEVNKDTYKKEMIL